MTIRSEAVSSGYTVSADILRGVIECAAQCGVPRTMLTAAIPDTAALSNEIEPERHTSAHLFTLWDRIIQLSGDPIIGFRMAQFARPGTYGALGQMLARCATVLEAFRQVEHFSTLVYQGSRIRIDADHASLRIVIETDLPNGASRPNIMLWTITNVARLPKTLSGAPIRPAAIECAFASPGPDAARALDDLGPFRFDTAFNRVVFDRSVGDLTVPSADRDLRSLLAGLMERDLKSLRTVDSFEQKLISILRRMMNGTMPTVAALSRAAGMSSRTLQRRLAETDTRFQDLLRQVLHESADELLARGDLSHGEIAFLLGYSEESAFSRAYRSWTGKAPRAARRYLGVRTGARDQSPRMLC